MYTLYFTLHCTVQFTCSEMHLFTSVHNNVYAVAYIICFKLQDLANFRNTRKRKLILAHSNPKLYTLSKPNVRARKYVCAYVCVNVYVCMYVCVCVCIYIYIPHNSVIHSMANSKWHAEAVYLLADYLWNLHFITNSFCKKYAELATT